MYRITIEEYDEHNGWVLVNKTTDQKAWTQYINLSGLATLLKLTRAQLRYRLEK